MWYTNSVKLIANSISLGGLLGYIPIDLVEIRICIMEDSEFLDLIRLELSTHDVIKSLSG